MAKEVTFEPWKLDLMKSYFNKSSCERVEPSKVKTQSEESEPVSVDLGAGLQAEDLSNSSVTETDERIESSACVEKEQNKEEEIPSSTVPSAIRTFRPKLMSKTQKSSPVVSKSCSLLVKDCREFPIQHINHEVKELGRNCVSVVLKSNSSSTETVSQRAQYVEGLSARYEVKYQEKSAQGTVVRLELCFKTSADARQFFGKVNDWSRSKNSPKSISVILTSEERLGKVFQCRQQFVSYIDLCRPPISASSEGEGTPDCSVSGVLPQHLQEFRQGHQS